MCFFFLNRGIVTDPLMIQDLFVWRFTRCQIEYTFAGNEPQDTQQLQDRVIRNSKAHHASYSILCVNKVFYPMASFTVGNKHLWPMFSSSFMPENVFGEVVRGTLYGRYFFFILIWTMVFKAWYQLTETNPGPEKSKTLGDVEAS